MKQTKLFKDLKNPLVKHQPEKGKRKSARPLAKGRPIHLILKSRYILLSHRRWIEEQILSNCKRFGIRNYRHSLCGDHIHFVIQIPHRSYYNKFIRALTGTIARKMGKGMWKLKPFTRIGNWGRDFRNLLAYIQKNHEETWILRKYEPRIYPKKRNGHYARPAVLAPCVPNAI